MTIDVMSLTVSQCLTLRLSGSDQQLPQFEGVTTEDDG